MSEELTNEEMARVILRSQMDAIARTVRLIGENRKLTLGDVLRELSEAEDRAQFVCGFTDLNADEKYKEFLKNHLVDTGFLVLDAEGNIMLTSMGRERTTVELPAQIERELVKIRR